MKFLGFHTEDELARKARAKARAEREREQRERQKYIAELDAEIDAEDEVARVAAEQPPPNEATALREEIQQRDALKQALARGEFAPLPKGSGIRADDKRRRRLERGLVSA